MAGTGKKKKSIRRRLIIIAVALVAVVALVVVYFVQANIAASAEKGTTIVKIGVDSDSDDDIWDAVNTTLAKENAKIKVKLVKMDGTTINDATVKKEVDLNAFQHRAYLNDQIDQHGYKLDVFANTIIQPMNVYSDKIKSLDELKSGDTVAVPDNATNLGRALKVLESAGVITTDPAKGYLPTVSDITKNPKHIKIVQVDAYQIPRVLPDNTAGILNANVAVDAGLNPAKDSIYSVKINSEDVYNKPWTNIIVGRKGDESNPVYRKVVEAYGSTAVKKVIEKSHSKDMVYVYKNLLKSSK